MCVYICMIDTNTCMDDMQYVRRRSVIQRQGATKGGTCFVWGVAGG